MLVVAVLTVRRARADPELAALAALREAAIAATEIWTGTDGPTYA